MALPLEGVKALDLTNVQAGPYCTMVLGDMGAEEPAFMGDDAVGVYQCLRRGRGSESSAVYAAFKALANLFWLAFWTVLMAVLLAGFKHGASLRPVQLLVPFAFLYSLLLHSVVESAGKYHVLMIGLLCVMLPMLALDTRLPASTGS